MPVLELLLLCLLPGVSPQDPTLVENLSIVRSLIHTNSRFYHCIEDPTLIYILGQWPSLATHKAFLSSPEKDAILSYQTHQLDFVWMLHLDLPEGKNMEDVLPFTAPVLGIARMIFNTSDPDVDVYQRILADYRSKVVGATGPFPLFDARRIDGDEGKVEYVILTGWESVEAHNDLVNALRVSTLEYVTSRGYVEGMEVRHMRNLEAW
jgi:heme-degrading monooxygenase HmoA